MNHDRETETFRGEITLAAAFMLVIILFAVGCLVMALYSESGRSSVTYKYVEKDEPLYVFDKAGNFCDVGFAFARAQYHNQFFVNVYKPGESYGASFYSKEQQEKAFREMIGNIQKSMVKE